MLRWVQPKILALLINFFSVNFTTIEIEGERLSSSQNKRTLGGEGQCSKTNKGKQGGGCSKLGDYEQTYFLNVPLWVELETNGGVIFITILLHFHYFISSETANTQKSEVFLLGISLGNVNASVVTCRYLKIYNFSFRKEFLETLCKCIYLGF